MVRCALVVEPDAEVGDELLELLAVRTGHRFAYHGSGGFGEELLAEVYQDEPGNLLIETRAIDAPVKAVVLSAESVEDAVAIRQVIGDHLGGWSEQMLRAQVEQHGLEDDPGLLVAIALAGGGGELDDESVDLINGAVEHEDEEIAGWAAYAVRVWNELEHPPLVVEDTVRDLAPILVPTGPVDGDETWVTVRPGVAGREIGRPTTWLRVNGGGWDVFNAAMVEHDWLYAVAGSPGSDWSEEIATTKDELTAVHLVRHPALDADYLVVHGEDVSGVVAALRDAGDVEPCAGPPTALGRTAF